MEGATKGKDAWSAKVWLKEQGLSEPRLRMGKALVCTALPGSGQKCVVGGGIEELLVCAGCLSARYCSKGELSTGFTKWLELTGERPHLPFR